MSEHEIIQSLFRALVWCGNQISDEQREAAWAWLEERGEIIEDMGS